MSTTNINVPISIKTEHLIDSLPDLAESVKRLVDQAKAKEGDTGIDDKGWTYVIGHVGPELLNLPDHLLTAHRTIDTYIPKYLAQVIIDLIEHTHNEGQSAENQEHETELIEYINDTYPELNVSGKWWY